MKSLRSHRSARRGVLVILAIVTIGISSIAPALAANPTARHSSTFTSFQSFLTQLKDSSYSSFKGDASLAQSPSQFSQSKSYLEHLYKSVDVRASFIIDGSYFDCVTVMTQPTVTALGIKHIAKPPPNVPAVSGSKLWTTAGSGQNGRLMSCPSGTIPMRRTTLRQVLSFHSLRDFFSKGGSGIPDSDIPGYRHAYGYDKVDNNGGGMENNVWNPKVVSTTEDHSLSQEWVLGTSASNLQSAEAGWTKDPDYSTKDPVYFIYFTEDDYGSDGCYNLECTGFVQVSNQIGLGAPVTPCCSTSGKVNDAFTQYYELYKGNWFLYNDGTEIGYYPVSIYKGGQMSKRSNLIEYGGEVYGGATNVNWPPMGSGKLANAGAEKAAYQSELFYFKGTSTFYPSLTTVVTGKGSTPSTCYSLKYTATSSTGPFFYYGGPGGKQSTC